MPAQEDASVSATAIKYISHRFSEGGSCVMTGASRSAEVRFTCLRNAADNMIASVKEFPTCNYIITVSTPLLCKHPEFQLQVRKAPMLCFQVRG